MLSYEEARKLTDEIKGELKEVYRKIILAFEGEAWKALEWGSWEEYVKAEFPMMPRLSRADRAKISAEMYEAGMTTREVGAALGVSFKTVANDLHADDDLSCNFTQGTSGAQLAGEGDLDSALKRSHPRSNEQLRVGKLAGLFHRAWDLHQAAMLELDRAELTEDVYEEIKGNIELLENTVEFLKERIRKYEGS
jgi:hypothetical protein